MKLSKKDIKKEFFKDGTQYGEIKPMVKKNGKLFVPTSDGLKGVKKEYGS